MSNGTPRPELLKSLVGFSVGDVVYAVPIGAVREIINPISLTALPHAPAVVAGVADHRGEVVPVVDLRLRFGVASGVEARRTKWILVEVGGRRIGLIVDRVTGVFGTHGKPLRPAPTLGGGEDERGIIGVTSHEGSMAFVLDVSRLEALTAGLSEPLQALPAGDHL